MSIVVKCDGCQRKFKAPDAAMGKTGKCPNCGTRIAIQQHVEPRIQRQQATSARRHHPNASPTGVVATQQVSVSRRRSSPLLIVAIVVGSSLCVAAAAIGYITVFTHSSPNDLAAREDTVSPVATESPEGEALESPNGAKTFEYSVPDASEPTDPAAHPGFSLTLEQFKQDIPIGEAWNVLSDVTRDDGSISFQLVSTTMENVMLMVGGDPENLNSISVFYAITEDQTSNDADVRVAVMALMLARYSVWTAEDFGTVIGRIIRVGIGEDEDVRIQKGGHEFWLSPLGVQGGTMFMTGIVVDPNSVAPTLEHWLKENPIPGIEDLVDSNQRSGGIGNGQFSYRGFRHKGGGEFIGEITNASRQAIDVATFELSVYNTFGDLIDVSPIMITNLQAGQTRSFKAFVDGTPDKFLYKIDFQSSF